MDTKKQVIDFRSVDPEKIRLRLENEFARYGSGDSVPATPDTISLMKDLLDLPWAGTVDAEGLSTYADYFAKHMDLCASALEAPAEELRKLAASLRDDPSSVKEAIISQSVMQFLYWHQLQHMEYLYRNLAVTSRFITISPEFAEKYNLEKPEA